MYVYPNYNKQVELDSYKLSKLNKQQLIECSSALVGSISKDVLACIIVKKIYIFALLSLVESTV